MIIKRDKRMIFAISNKCFLLKTNRKTKKGYTSERIKKEVVFFSVISFNNILRDVCLRQNHIIARP